MTGQSKAARRRYNDGAFLSRYFVGRGVDVGGRPDPLEQYVGMFPLMVEVRTWDLEDGDGQLMESVEDRSYDFLHSSHCLEHLVDPHEALRNWIRVVRPGGHIIVTVPDEDMYEQGVWPSTKNTDHKHTFTMAKPPGESWSPVSINVLSLLAGICGSVFVESVREVRDFYYSLPREKQFDQTLLPNTECVIEFILRRRI